MCLTCRANEAFAIKATSRRNFLRSIGGAAASFALAPSAFAKDSKAPPKPQNDVPPDAALQRLMKGNARYVEGRDRGDMISRPSARRWSAGKIPMRAS